MTSHLLFVDEDKEFLQGIRDTVKGDYAVETANSIHLAQQLLQLDEFDVVICNVRLLESNGIPLFAWIRERRPNVIRIALCESSSVDGVVAALRESAFDYLCKPLEPNSFAYCIQRAMTVRRLTVSEKASWQSLEKLNRQFGDRVRRATRELLIANEHLSEANRAKDQFLAAMSHELRTPMTAITGAVKILQSRNTSVEKTQSILDILDRNANTLKRLLDDLLDSSRISSGKLSLELCPTNVNEAVEAALETMRTKAVEAKVELRCFLPKTPLTVIGNPLRLQQIAWNLIDNSIKFTPPGGYVAVSVARRNNCIELMVSDSGSGLSRQDLERIFEPFAQANASDSLKKGGLGLGLALVRSLTQLHNGKVRAESEGHGHGARFIVSLPVAERAFPVNQVA